MTTTAQTEVKMPCVECGGWPKNHRVIHEFLRQYHDEEGLLEAQTRYQICQCMGCDYVSFRESKTSAEDRDEHGDHPETVSTYPQIRRSTYRAMQTNELPPAVGRIYAEMISAANVGANTLAGGGLRAIVEGICLDQKVTGKNLKEKIDDLVGKQLLARPQADLLHEERYIGNSALHELLPPTTQELRDGIKIVEGLMNAIYILPKHAEKLRENRLKKRTP